MPYPAPKKTIVIEGLSYERTNTGRYDRDGKSYRMRRGKLVEIPEKWLGKVPTRATMAKRPSHHIHKLRKQIKHGGLTDSKKKVVEQTKRASEEALLEN